MSVQKVTDAVKLLPLKEMDGTLLTISIMDNSNRLGLDIVKIADALRISSFFHRNALRKNRGKMPVTHYIEHPLRNTLRLIRWGVTDTDVIIASILHDTVEDCAQEIVSVLSSITNDELMLMDENEIRVQALKCIEKLFNPRIARIVDDVSNPISVVSVSRDERYKTYREHVSRVIVDNPDAFYVKLSDFMDNAGSLFHTSGHSDMTRNLAKKYLPLVDVFVTELLMSRICLKDDIKENIRLKLVKAQTSMIEFSA